MTPILALSTLEPEHHLLPTKITGHGFRSQPVLKPMMNSVHHALGSGRTRCVYVRVAAGQGGGLLFETAVWCVEVVGRGDRRWSTVREAVVQLRFRTRLRLQSPPVVHVELLAALVDLVGQVLIVRLAFWHRRIVVVVTNVCGFVFAIRRRRNG